MKNISEKQDQQIGRVIAAVILLGLSFYGLTHTHFYYIQYSFLAIAGLLSYIIVFGISNMKNLFRKPIHFFRTFVFVLIGSQLYGFLSAFLMGALSKILDIQTKANSAQENPWWFFIIIMPIALLGEEIFSITILDILRKKFNINALVASLITAIIFGLIHFGTYLGSSAWFTIVQIILVQGGARVWFNHAYLKTKSINTSWGVHYIYDLIAFVIGGIL